MKRFFLFILPVLLVITACKAPEEIVLPDKNLNVADRTIVYKKEFNNQRLFRWKEDGNEGCNFGRWKGNTN